MRALLSILVFVCAFALNPAYVVGCGAGDDDFEFSEAEMLRLSERSAGSYPFTVDGQDYVLKLDLAPQAQAKSALFASSAYACDSRAIFPTASACVDSSTVQMAGTLQLERVVAAGSTELLASGLAVAGNFTVYGRELGDGFLELRGPEVDVMLSSDSDSFELQAFYGDKLGDAGAMLTFKND